MKPKELEILLSRNCNQIKKNYGFELTWFEKVALKYYINSFLDRDGEKSITMPLSALHYFILDYFGLDNFDLGYRQGPVLKGGKWTSTFHGLNFLGTPEFKEYCRRNVDFWREDRSLPDFFSNH